MNRAFKTQFHNGSIDEKPIVTMSVRVDNGKKFKSLDKEGKKELITCLEEFQKKVGVFISEIKKS